jgi:hypothetical protein
MSARSNPSSAWQSKRRGLGIGMLASLVAAGLGIAAPSWAQTSMAGTWSINGNGYPGNIILSQQAGGELFGTIYNGEWVDGFHSSDSRIAVLLRGSPFKPTQAFVGELDGATNDWRGTFYSLNTAMGGTAARNAFGFSAVRGNSGNVSYSAPVLGPAAPHCLTPNFTVRNRPSEYTNWTFSLNLDNPSPPFGCITGEFKGTIAGDTIYGHYAPGSGSIVFLRMNANRPAQLYVGQVTGGTFLNPQRIAGSFYALTYGMGATTSRMRYEWETVP